MDAPPQPNGESSGKPCFRVTSDMKSGRRRLEDDGFPCYHDTTDE
jgi:hypothetical protein